MTWPVSGPYEARVSGTTVIKKQWADDMDTRWNGLFAGTRSLLGAVFDATGDVATTRPGAGEQQAIEYGPVVPTFRKLVRQWAISNAGGVGTYYFREYHTGTGREYTINAFWKSGTAKWSQDSVAQPSFIERSNLTGTAGSMFRGSVGLGGGDWDDSTWVALLSHDGVGNLVVPGYAQVKKTFNGTGGSGGSAGQFGAVAADTIDFASGIITLTATTGALTVTEGVNIDTNPANTGRLAAGRYKVSFQQPAPNGVVVTYGWKCLGANFSVLAIDPTLGALAGSVTFNLWIIGGGGAPVNNLDPPATFTIHFRASAY